MPLQSAHVFASHIGHTGKTTLSFHLSCQYAKKREDVSVLVMDLAEEGDLTKRMLGGVDASKEKVDEVFGAVFRLLGDADRKTSSLTRWLWSQTVDIKTHAIRVADHNPNVPGNVYLLSSGAWPRSEEPWSEQRRRALCAKILESLERSADTWKLFCDTDGDRRPSAFTMLAYGLCPQAIVPVGLSKSDLDRTETMFSLMAHMRRAGEISTQVLMVVWNNVKSVKDEPCAHRGATLAFSPSKVSLDILDACNRRLADLARDPDFEGVFVHGGAGVPAEQFIASSTAVMRQLADNVQKPAEELGLPFVMMAERLAGKSQVKFKSGGVEYEAKRPVVECASAAVDELCARFEAMVVDEGR